MNEFTEWDRFLVVFIFGLLLSYLFALQIGFVGVIIAIVISTILIIVWVKPKPEEYRF